MTHIGVDTSAYLVGVPGHPDAAFSLDWAAQTDVGLRRSHNEDSLIAVAPIFAVADGMGGHSAGDLASAAVVSRLEAVMARGDATQPDTAQPDTAQPDRAQPDGHSHFTSTAAIEIALAEATDEISIAVDEKKLGIGTTVTGAALTLHEGRAYFTVFNVGDSRVYLFEGTELRQVSIDHSLVQELVDTGMITALAAESHPQRNEITRAVGFNREQRPDYWQIPLRGDIRLLICSDGLTNELEHATIQGVLANRLGPPDTVRELVNAALAAGGRDNISAIVVDVREVTPGEPEIHTAPR